MAAECRSVHSRQLYKYTTKQTSNLTLISLHAFGKRAVFACSIHFTFLHFVHTTPTKLSKQEVNCSVVLFGKNCWFLVQAPLDYL